MDDWLSRLLSCLGWLQAWSPSQRKRSWVWGGSLSCGHMLSTFHYPRPTSFKTNNLLLVLLMEGLSCICNQEIVTLLANRLTTKIPPPPLLHVMLSFLLFWVGPQWELGAMAQRHRLMLKLSWQAKAGSEKIILLQIFSSMQWRQRPCSNLGMTMRALPCAGTLPPGADSFERWAA